MGLERLVGCGSTTDKLKGHQIAIGGHQHLIYCSVLPFESTGHYQDRLE